MWRIKCLHYGSIICINIPVLVNISFLALTSSLSFLIRKQYFSDFLFCTKHTHNHVPQTLFQLTQDRKSWHNLLFDTVPSLKTRKKKHKLCTKIKYVKKNIHKDTRQENSINAYLWRAAINSDSIHLSFSLLNYAVSIQFMTKPLMILLIW